MAETIGTYYFQIAPSAEGVGGNIEDMLNGSDSIGGVADSLSGTFSAALGVAGAAMAAVTAAAGIMVGAIVEAGDAFLDAATSAAEYGDNVDKMSQKMGISAEAYQEWEAVMQHSGTSMEVLKASMKTMATQAQKNNEAFQALGITEEEVATLSQEDLFGRVIEGLQGMEEGTERTAVASALLGKGATELGALMNTSAADTEAMRQQVHDLGGVMDEDAVKASARFQDQLQDMQTALDGAKRNIMSEFLPSITTVMEGLTDVFSGKDGGDKISKGIEEFSNNLLNAIPKLLEIGAPIVEGIGSAIINNLPMLIDTATQTILTLVGGIVDHLPDIVTAGVQIILTLISGLSDSLPELIPAMVEAIAQMSLLSHEGEVRV